jgi:hypothetical protein
MVIAHQGGWDEVLLIALPVVVFAVLLFFANRHTTNHADEDDEPRGDA